MSVLLDTAFAIALRAHKDQTRKGDDTPYIVHPVAVALLLARHRFPDYVIAAAFTHDVLEDTSITSEELQAAIGEKAYNIVRTLTHDNSLPWKERKAAYIASVRTASDEAKAISVADKIHNAESLLELYETEGSLVWSHFNRGRDEKLWFENEMLAMLKETWEHPLVDEYETLVVRMNMLA